VTEFRQTLDQYKEHIDRLTSRVERLIERDNGQTAFPPILAAEVAVCRDQAGPSDDPSIVEAVALLEAAVPTEPTSNPPTFLDELHEVVQQIIPPEAAVAVVSEGEDELLQLGARRTWHFPLAADGSYAGYLQDDAAAIAHLHEVRTWKGEFLVVPSRARRWLDHYPAFQRYLEDHFAVHASPENGCLVFDLRPSAEEQEEYRDRIQRIREVVDRTVPLGATVAVVNEGDEELLQLGERRTWPFFENPNGPVIGWPKSVVAAINQLEALRARGADFLLIPASAVEWMNRHPEFEHYLARHDREEVGRADSCRLFALCQPTAEEQQRFQQRCRLIGEVVDRQLPPDATVLVLSEGFEEFLQLGSRQAWHFPQAPDGSYAGCPEASEAAIAHLEEQRARGAGYLLVPYGARWWLEFYGDFRLHLENHYRVAIRYSLSPEQEVCTLYALNPFVKQPPAADTPLGVNVAGYCASEKGVGEAVRSVIRSLEAVQFPYVVNNCTDLGSANQDAVDTPFAYDNPFVFNLINLNAANLPEFVSTRGDGYFQGHYNIGSWAWELSDFPNDWEASFQYLDEIWAPSNFVLDAVARVSPIPVVRIPYSLNEQLAVKPWTRAHFGLPQESFMFLYIFDFDSIVERKHPFGVIEAFRRAFSSRDDVLLVLKGSHPTRSELQAVQKAAAGAYVRLIDSILSREEVNTLLQLADCYVSLHRSEGFGLTMAEAMSLEKPVIATGYSGNMDFMTPANSFLVDYNLIELDREYPPYKKGSVWADPSLEHAAQLMRFVYENRELARQAGRKARADILRHCHPQVVGKLITERLRKLRRFWGADQ
jgi:glycosyltransferase involved in cell wall biosynthesis